MNTPLRILLTLISFAVPLLMVFLVILGAFLMYGSGAQSGMRFENDQHWWIGTYAILSSIHLVVLHRLLKPWNMLLKWSILTLLAGVYVYYGMDF